MLDSLVRVSRRVRWLTDRNTRVADKAQPHSRPFHDGRVPEGSTVRRSPATEVMSRQACLPTFSSRGNPHSEGVGHQGRSPGRQHLHRAAPKLSPVRIRWKSTHSTPQPQGNNRHPRLALELAESNELTPGPPVSFQAVSRPLELSLQSSLQLSLAVLVCYRSRGHI